MNASQPDNEAIFHAARDIPDPDRRREYVRAACGEDESRIAYVEALLAAAERPDSLLDRPAAGTGAATIDQPTTESAGTTIGHYKLLEQIGEGGMGTVWMAEQTEPIQRRVAVKVVKEGMDSRQVLARFEAERQALALMDHPSIARVLDAGKAPSGRPYFVMELVKGQPITRYCDEKRLGVRERLALFGDVCRAVQHAHQKGIIHRDLKPSNVLVAPYDGKPVVKVIDFGVAKATGQRLTDETLFTGFGALVGTPEYMSPEQAEINNQDIDTRSDIYSLGVVLYELLTGTPPFTRKGVETAGLLETLRAIREQEPTRPSAKLSTAEGLPTLAANRGTEPAKLTRLVRGELDWIVMKALEKDRNRRYETADGFAQDIQRYLADEPVLACPPSLGYRLRKFARRHRAALLTTALVSVVVLLAGFGIGWALWQRGQQHYAQVKRQADTEQAVSVALAKAEQSEAGAQRLPRLTSEQAKLALAEWRQAVSAIAEAEAALKTGAASEDLRARVAAVQQRIEQEWTQAVRWEKLLSEVDDARLTAATMSEGKFNYVGGAAKYREAFAAYGLEMRPGDTAEWARRLGAEEPAIREVLLAALADWAITVESAATTSAGTELHALADVVDDDAWRQRRRAAQAAHDVARLRELSGEARRSTLPPSKLVLLAQTLYAVGCADDALKLLRWAQAEYPGDFGITFALGTRLSLDKRRLPSVDLEDAISYLVAAKALRPEATAVRNNLGLALKKRKRLDEAITELKKAIELDPKNAPVHTNLGNVLHDKKQLDAAIAEHKLAIALDPRYAPAHNNLGVSLLANQQPDEAITEFNKAIELDSKAVTPRYNLVTALRQKKRLDEALAECEQAIARDPNDAHAHNNFGLVLYDKQQLDAAIAAFKKVIELDPEIVIAHDNLGLALAAKQQLDAAIAEYKKAIDLDPQLASPHNNLGNALRQKRQLDDAIAEWRKAVALDPNLAQTHYNLGLALKAKNQLDEASVAFHKAIEASADYAEAYCNLGDVLRLQGRCVESLSFFRRGHELGSKRPDWHYPSAEWVRVAERVAAVEEKLPALQKGDYQPRDYDEWSIFVELCRVKQLYRTAAGLYADAFARDGKQAEDLKAAHRYNATSAAALAGCGRGKDADKLDDQERARLRSLALDWLSAELEAQGRLLDKEPARAAANVAATLQRWLVAPDFGCVRGPQALAELPEAERPAWQKLWKDVADMLKRAQEKAASQKK